MRKANKSLKKSKPNKVNAMKNTFPKLKADPPTPTNDTFAEEIFPVVI